jgi:hypothetical protein
MALLDSLMLTVAPALAKSILKVWLKDYDIASDVASSLIDLLKSKGADTVAQHRGKRQFEEVGEKIAENLLPLFEADGAKISESSRNAVALMVADTLNNVKISPEFLVERHLDPIKLANHLLDSNPAATRDFSEAEAELYRRVVIESSQYIVDIASQLPHFTERTFAEILKRENQVLVVASNILDEVRRLREGSKNTTAEADSSKFEVEYRRAVVRKLDELELFGVDASNASRRHRLSVAYITLSVGRKLKDKIDWESSFRLLSDKKEEKKEKLKDEDDDRDIMPVDFALARSRRLLIRGLAGSGKTTLLQWIAVRSASQSFDGSLAHFNNTVPFFIRLRQCVETGFPAPENFPKLIAPVIAIRMPAGWVHDKLETGEAIVLIDGIDEVSESHRQGIRQGLKELVETYPKSQFIVTSRPSAIEHGWLRKEGFDDAELQPMQLPDILAFIEHWHKAVRDELQEEEEKLALKPLAANIAKIVRKNSQVRDLATSPLLCAMICALHRDRRQQIPSDRIELYEACCHMLIERRDIERGVELRDYTRLSYRQKSMILKDLAYWFLKNGWSAAPIERVEERVQHKITNMTGLPQDTSGADIVRLFIERSGIIKKPVPDQLDFTHRTFQEFLAAHAALDEGDIGALIKNAHDDQWRETVLVATGLTTNNKDREEIIKGIIKRGDKEGDKQHQLYLLAMACIDNSIEVGSVLKKIAEERLSKLLPPKTILEAKALASAGELAIPYLSGFKQAEPSVISFCIHALSVISGPAALDSIEEYSHEPHESLVEDFVRAWRSFDGNEYAERVLSGVLRRSKHLKLGSDFLLEGIEHFKHLTALRITNNFRLKDLSPLKELTNLTVLELPGCESLKDLKAITSLPNLRALDLYGCSQVDDLTPIAGLTNLITLGLGECYKIVDLSPISGLKHLESLDLSNCMGVSDLNPLEGLLNVNKLSLYGCQQIRDIKPLSELVNLIVLNLSYCENVRDLTILKKLVNLKSLWLRTHNETVPHKIPPEILRSALIHRHSRPTLGTGLEEIDIV